MIYALKDDIEAEKAGNITISYKMVKWLENYFRNHEFWLDLFILVIVVRRIIIFNISNIADILKHTPESNPDHKHLNEAVETVKKVLT